MSLRLFVALDLPGEVVDALDDFGRRAAQDGLRRVPRESLHVTLAFLGSRPEEEVEPIGEAVAACAAPVPAVSFGDAAWLPPRRPRVLAVDLVDGDGACGRVQACVSAALEALGVYRPEQRAFRAHVTVARVRHGARVSPDLPDPPSVETFAAPSLTLYRSHLGPKGARYEALSRTPLT